MFVMSLLTAHLMLAVNLGVGVGMDSVYVAMAFS